MPPSVHGIHHVTAIAGDPQANLDFYVGVLGMRLVKKSVNQDVPDTYHLFYADEAGTPGTDLTFFPWPSLPPVTLGVGFTVEVPFTIPAGSLPYWQERLARHNIVTGAVETRFGETVLTFVDPHGLALALVESAAGLPITPWAESNVPAEYQVRGMHSVRLWERSLTNTAALLTRVMGFSKVGEEDGWHRYAVEGGGPGCLIDLKENAHAPQGEWGVGGVHHVAWRVKDPAEELALRRVIAEAGLQPTPPIDRFWFQSVYFREPGGCLFELATDGPGFDRDEDPAHLGEKLVLAPWLEAQRPAIEAGLQPLVMPAKELS
jgi:glyoxalase family protein